jgi:GxxExxY protein
MNYVNIENDLDDFDNQLENDLDNDILINYSKNKTTTNNSNSNNSNSNNSNSNNNSNTIDFNSNEINIINEIINISNNVFRVLGKGFVESIYHKAILVDLYNTNYIIETKKIIPIMYNYVNVGYVESDIIVYDKINNVTIIVELKSQEKDLNNKEIIQVQKYMRNIEQKNNIGLVINFPQKTTCQDIIQYKLIK